jgi:hypothetical protein
LIVTKNNSAMVREYESFTNLYKFLNSILKNSEVQSLRPDLKISDLARVVADLDTQNAFCFEDPNDPAGQSDGHRIILEALNATQSVQKSVESKKASLIAKGKPEIAERIGKLPIAQSAERSMYIIEAAGPFVCEKAYSDFTKGGASGVTAERLISQSGQATLPKKMSEFAQHHDNSVFAASVVISTAYKVKNLVSLSPQDLRSANRMWLKAEIDSSGLFDTWMHDRMLAKNKELESIHPHLTDAELVNAIVSLDQKGAFCADARNPEDQDQMRASILAELGATGEASKQRANIEKDQAKFKISWPN